ncbi:flagellin N-terminal helical domain-containing protein [Macromonas nakdongensis]|uniref:flagellin N-terminal helical domain-containing protein n=1 Tax=Macromonas nakdongensis TaxID=1843082 RepID=UPI000C31F0A5|nr:flagellin [Macromonas nakdongensis]
MAATINSNILSLNAQRNLTTSQTSLSTSVQRLSSGLRINSAKDDAAGLAISERFSTQIRGLNQAVRNANDGISLAQTAEGALASIGNNLQRIRELAVQSRNATNSDTDRSALQAEVAQLKEEIDRVANQTSFNGTKLLDGSFTAKVFQVGADQGQTININSIADANVAALGAWTSVTTPATPVAGVAPTGTGAVAGTAAVPTDSPASGAFTSAVSDTDGQNFTLTVGGVEIVNVTQAGGVPETVDAAALDNGLTTAAAALTAAGITYTGSFATDDIVFSKADGTDFDITLTSDFATPGSFAGAGFVGTQSGGTPAVPAVAGTFGAVDFTINGTTVSVGASTDAADRLSDMVTAINGQTGTTGVTAAINAGALTLTAVSGSGDINLASANADFTALTGFTAGDNLATPGTAQTGFSSLDISTAVGADNAILAMDAALTTVNSARADLGAIQNRFSSVVDNLSITAENLTASRSRIMDADFAAETAALSRAQILQQAGTAMVAQANQLPQGVLALLR